MPRLFKMTALLAAAAMVPALALRAQQAAPAAAAQPATKAAAQAAPATTKATTSTDPIERIKEEGLKRSQVMATLSYLTDVIGPRLTGSPNLKHQRVDPRQAHGMGPT